MSKTITVDVGNAQMLPVIHPSVDLAPHSDGTIEALMRIETVEIDRPSGIRGDLVVRLDGVDAGSVDLILSVEVAEKLGLAMIRAAALSVGDPAQPSRN